MTNRSSVKEKSDPPTTVESGGFGSNEGESAAVPPPSGARTRQAVNLIGSKGFLVAKLIYVWREFGVLSSIKKLSHSFHQLARNGFRSFLLYLDRYNMTRRKSVGRKFKGGTGRSKRDRIGAGGVGPCYGSTPPVTPAEETVVAMPNGMAASASKNEFFLPFVSGNSEKTDTAVLASLKMTHSEYGKLLVTMGKSKERLPNLNSKTMLDYILVTLEFSQDDYDVLLELKNKMKLRLKLL